MFMNIDVFGFSPLLSSLLRLSNPSLHFTSPHLRLITGHKHNLQGLFAVLALGQLVVEGRQHGSEASAGRTPAIRAEEGTTTEQRRAHQSTQQSTAQHRRAQHMRGEYMRAEHST